MFEPSGKIVRQAPLVRLTALNGAEKRSAVASGWNDMSQLLSALDFTPSPVWL